MELLKYVNKELERLDCVDWNQCSDILETLSNMSELLMIDINIYSSMGELVSTSRPEIFQYGFDGVLVFRAKTTELLDYYQREFGARQVGAYDPFRLVIWEDAAERLIAEYRRDTDV